MKTLTNGELIALLQQYPSDASVIIEGSDDVGDVGGVENFGSTIEIVRPSVPVEPFVYVPHEPEPVIDVGPFKERRRAQKEAKQAINMTVSGDTLFIVTADAGYTVDLKRLEPFKDSEDLSTEAIMDQWDETFAKDGTIRFPGIENFTIIKDGIAYAPSSRRLAVDFGWPRKLLEPVRMLIDDAYNADQLSQIVEKLNEVIARLNAQGGK